MWLFRLFVNHNSPFNSPPEDKSGGDHFRDTYLVEVQGLYGFALHRYKFINGYSQKFSFIEKIEWTMKMNL